MTKKGGSAREQLVCLEPLEGKPIWSSGKDNRFGWGPYVIANAKIYLCDDEGTLTMARATPEGYEELGEAKIWQAHESWGPPAIVNGRMLLRDLHHLVCVDLRAEN
jgi:outer membrane protein assembly factor BamB